MYHYINSFKPKRYIEVSEGGGKIPLKSNNIGLVLYLIIELIVFMSIHCKVGSVKIRF